MVFGELISNYVCISSRFCIVLVNEESASYMLMRKMAILQSVEQFFYYYYYLFIQAILWEGELNLGPPRVHG